MKPKVLHVITVYNGREFVPRAVESAVRMDSSDANIDVLILDDASPEPGWSEDLANICRNLGAHYYLSPRNLGIPRNVSLGMLAAVKKNYDYVTINNSDVIFPANLISIMLEACKVDKVGSVTAWSNNVSIYSLPNCDPDRHLASQETVDFISKSLAEKYGASVVDIPAGISFCIMMPTEVVKDVGLMDPVFGRGYCEETDWSLRSLKKGYRVCLCPGSFVYHQGRGSNVAAGLVSGAHSTVPENEAIIDMRFPMFRQQVLEFERAGTMTSYKDNAVDYLIDSAAKAFGYAIYPGWRPKPAAAEAVPVSVEVMPDGFTPNIRFTYAGFEQIWPLGGSESIKNAIDRFGSNSLRHNAFDCAACYGLAFSKKDNALEIEKAPYPQSIW